MSSGMQDGRVVILRMKDGNSTFLCSEDGKKWSPGRHEALRWLPEAAKELIDRVKFPFEYKSGEILTDTTWHPEIEHAISVHVYGLYEDPKVVQEYAEKFGKNSLIYFAIKALLGDVWRSGWEPTDAKGLSRLLNTFARISMD